MKKILVGLLFTITTISLLSFTTTQKSTTVEGAQPFKKYIIGVSQTTTSGGCTFTITMMVEFYWDGPGTQVTGAQVAGPVLVSVNCGFPNNYSRSTSTTSLSFSSSDGHTTSLAFAATSTKAVDDVLSSINFLDQIKDDMDDKIDLQKDF